METRRVQERWRYTAYCLECTRPASYGDKHPGSLHRMADQYRPQEAEETKTADPKARRSTKEREFD